MAYIDIANISHTGNLPSANYTSTSCSWQYTIDSTTRGNSYRDLITIGKTYGTYKVGVLTFSNTGSTSLTVRVVNGSTTVSGSIYSGHGWSTYVNYNHQGDPDDDTDGQNWFYIDIPSSGPGGGGTLTVSWTALDTNNSRLASYTVDTTDFTYDGQQHHITLSSATGCSIVTTTYGTNIGTYNQVITATNGTTQFADCYYFIENGVPVATSTQSWTISPVPTVKPTKIYVNGSWVNAIPYIYNNGSWREATAYIYSGGQWKETKA